ncbi:substrate-binding domain-containing protein [Salinigranum rubrum]|nr:substrate-binding domain-containing protein [Salinigranum rubrum]
MHIYSRHALIQSIIINNWAEQYSLWKLNMRDNHSRRRFMRALGATGLGVGLAGCAGSGGGSNGGGSSGEGDSSGGSSGSDSSGEVLFDLDAIEPDELVGEGPFGSDASPPSSVELTDEEVKEIQEGDYSVEIVFQFKQDTWVRLQEKAIRQRCDELGIEITGVQYPDFDPEQQSNMLQTVAQKSDVDGIFSIPVDTAATKGAYRAVADAGKELVFMDNVPDGFEHPEDYTGVVAADNRAMGLIGGRMLESLVDGGKIIVLEFDVPFYVVDEREAGMKSVLEPNDDYQLETFGFTDPGNVTSLAQNALTANPDAVGVWAPWVDPPGAQAVQALEEQGMDIPLVSCDLGRRGAVLMAERSPLKGVGSQQPFAQGLAEVDMMAKGLLGKETPPYVALPSPAVARQNLLEMYEKIIREEPPEEVTKHFQ